MGVVKPTSYVFKMALFPRVELGTKPSQGFVISNFTRTAYKMVAIGRYYLPQMEYYSSLFAYEHLGVKLSPSDGIGFALLIGHQP